MNHTFNMRRERRRERGKEEGKGGGGRRWRKRWRRDRKGETSKSGKKKGGRRKSSIPVFAFTVKGPVEILYTTCPLVPSSVSVASSVGASTVPAGAFSVTL